MTLKKLQRFAEAVPHLKDAATQSPQVKLAFLELADAYYAVGRTDEAYHALEVCEREEIEPAQTAFLKGLVLAQKGKLTEAATSFEKARSLDAELGPASDFQIATVYGRHGRVRDARDLFRTIADRDPESDIGGVARQQEEALTSRLLATKPFHASADLTVLYDTNVILKPDAASAQTASISDQRDTSAALTVRAEYAPELRLPYGVRFLYSLYANKYNRLSAYDVQSHTVGISPSYRIGEAVAALDLEGNYTLVDNAKYLRTLTLSPNYTLPIGEEGSARVYLRYEGKAYLVPAVTTDENRDGNEYAGGAAWLQPLFDDEGYVTVRYELNRELTKGRNWSYVGNRLFAGLRYPATDRWHLAASLDAYLQDFDATRQDPFTTQQVRRKDGTYTVGLQCLYAVAKAVDLHLDYLYIKNTSTMDLYAYEKHMIGAGLTAKF
jgi:tetratricopeptide (TPR) repeat protein